MDRKLFTQALIKFTLGILITGILVFLPAGTMAFKQGWLFMAVLFVPMFSAGVVLMIKSPELLKKRLASKEKRKEQGMVVKLSALMFIGGFIVAGLNFRLGWHAIPCGVSLVAAVTFLLSYVIYAEVMRENAYLSRIIEVQEGQKVVDTGLYAIVRHPMYGATVIMFLSMPLILGSFYAFVIFLIYPFITAKRIHDEEEMLENELDGYSEYKKKVRYKMIPFIW